MICSGYAHDKADQRFRPFDFEKDLQDVPEDLQRDDLRRWSRDVRI